MSSTSYTYKANNLNSRKLAKYSLTPQLSHRDQRTFRRVHYLMGSFIEIEARGRDKEKVFGAINASFREMRRIELILSKFMNISLTSRINQYANKQPVNLTEEIFDLIKNSMYHARLTEGVFDITIDPLIELWTEAQNRNRCPTQEEIKKTLRKVGYQKILLDGRNKEISFMGPGMKINFGAIGKGYAIDRAVDVLRHHHIQNAMVNCESTIYCLDGESSLIGIKNPLDSDVIVATVALKNKAISTSALNEQFFSIKGKNYGHIIHPATGQPVSNSVISVSTISPSAKISDIYSTAIFILGLKKGKKLIERTANLEGIIMTKSFGRIKIWASKGARYDKC